MGTLDLEQTLRRMELLHRLALASRAGRPWRPLLDRRPLRSTGRRTAR